MSALAPQINESLSPTASPTTQDVLTDWQTAYPPEAWKQIRAEGIYLACVLSFGVVVSIILLKIDFVKYNRELLQQFLFCALGGIAGSWIYSMKWYVRAITHRLWRHDLVVWRLTSPFMGIFLSVSAYAILKARLLGVSLGNNQQTDTKLYPYAVGFLVGLCSDVVMGKLTEVAETLFGRTTSRHPQKP